MEQGRGPHPTAPRGNSPNDLLDDLDYADLEEQEGNTWQDEDVWQRPSSAQQRSAVNMNQSTNQRHGSLDITHGTDAALQQFPLHHTVERQHHVGQLYAQQGQTQQGRSQQDVTAQTQEQPRLQQAQQLALQSQHHQTHPQAAEAAGDHNRAGDHMQTAGLIVVSQPSASVTGESCEIAMHQQSGASPRRPGLIQTSVGLMTLLNQQSAAEQGMFACLDQPVPLQLAPQQNADSAAAPSHTEQSDRELALRLQEEEDAVQRQQQQIVPGRLLPKSNSRKPTGTIHAFFKKA